MKVTVPELIVTLVPSIALTVTAPSPDVVALPVAVAARTDREVWVVNHLSDSVSVIDLDERDGDLTGQVGALSEVAFGVGGVWPPQRPSLGGP